MSLAAVRQARSVRWLIRTLGVDRVVTAVGLLQLPVRALLGAILPRTARDPRLVALGAPLDRFADNSAYLFVHLSTTCPELRPVWITGSMEVRDRLRKQGLAAELRWSYRGVLHCLRAGSFVYSGYRSDINSLLAPGAVAVSLWHGIGIKRVGAGVPDVAARQGGLAARLAAAAKEPPADYFLSSTDYVTRHIFSPAFGTPPERCWELGYPRNDHLVAEIPPPAPLIASRQLWDQLAAAGPVVGVFLTWRGDRVDDVVDEDLLLRLAALARRHGGVLAYKAHYNTQPTSVLAENCALLPPTADLNAYLGLCDVLVTDYSSVAADFLLMRRPVVYFMPDLEEYGQRPGFYFEPDRLPGTITQTPEALLDAVADVLARPPHEQRWGAADEDLVRLLWGDHREPAAPRVARALTEAVARRPE